jgi:predicted ATPase
MNQRFVITGGPGAAKTMLLYALTTRGYLGIAESNRAIIQNREAAGLGPRPSLEQFGWDAVSVNLLYGFGRFQALARMWARK